MSRERSARGRPGKDAPRRSAAGERTDGRIVALEPAALDASCAAAFLSVSRSHWLHVVASGRAPAGAKLGARRLWARAELEAWLLAGCPSAARWEEMRATGSVNPENSAIGAAQRELVLQAARDFSSAGAPLAALQRELASAGISRHELHAAVDNLAREYVVDVVADVGIVWVVPRCPPEVVRCFNPVDPHVRTLARMRFPCRRRRLPALPPLSANGPRGRTR